VPLVSYLKKLQQSCRGCFLCQKKTNSANLCSVGVYFLSILHLSSFTRADIDIVLFWLIDWLIVLSLFLSLSLDIVLWLSFAFTNLYGKSYFYSLSSFITLKFGKKTKTKNLISLSWFDTNFDSILWFINKWLGMKNEKVKWFIDTSVVCLT